MVGYYPRFLQLLANNSLPLRFVVPGLALYSLFPFSVFLGSAVFCSVSPLALCKRGLRCTGCRVALHRSLGVFSEIIEVLLPLKQFNFESLSCFLAAKNFLISPANTTLVFSFGGLFTFNFGLVSLSLGFLVSLVGWCLLQSGVFNLSLVSWVGWGRAMIWASWFGCNSGLVSVPLGWGLVFILSDSCFLNNSVKVFCFPPSWFGFLVVWFLVFLEVLWFGSSCDFSLGIVPTSGVGVGV